MVVTCEECHTKFVLDENRIKGLVTKVRCSRCGQVFQVAKEGAPQDPVLPAEDAASPAPYMGGMEEQTPDLNSLREEGDPQPDRRDLEEEPEAPVAPTSFPKPSILFTTPAKRSPYALIAYIVGGFLVGLLVCGVLIWFWGFPSLANFKLKGKAPATAPVAKAPAASAVEILSPPPAPAGSPGDLKDLELTNQEERYRGLVNNKGGQLLLIQGKVKNSSNQPRGPIQIKAVLTDAQHKTTKQREFYAGTVIFDDELQNLDPEEINRWFDTPGGRAQKQTLEPGEAQAFMVVFFDAPQNLSGYGYKMQVIKGAVAPGKSPRP